MDITTQERCRSYVLPNLDSFRPNGITNNKNEIDNSIKLVETVVNTLAEEQALPFGIDDALNQFEQCTQVLALIDMPHLSQITQYSAELMRQDHGSTAANQDQLMWLLSVKAPPC